MTTEKIRVKCANCGMIHDVYVNTCFKQSCPGCGSNAYDKLKRDEQIWSKP